MTSLNPYVAPTQPSPERSSDPDETLHSLGKAFAGSVETLLAALNAENLARVRGLRVQIVEVLLASSAPFGPAVAATLKDIAAACLKAQLRSFARNEVEERLFARCRAALAGANAENVGVRALGAVMMSWHAAELETLPSLAMIAPELRPSWLTFLMEVPPAFARTGDAGRFAEYLQRLCDQILDHFRTTPGPVDDVAAAFFGSLIFVQGYFNEFNLRKLMRSRGVIIEEVLRRAGAPLDELRVARRCGARPRIGFISLAIGDSTEGALLAAHMERLDRSRLDVRLYSIVAPDGKLGAACRAAAEAYVQLPRQVLGAVGVLRREKLDVAVFCTNLTAASHLLTQIAAHRVAPIQVTDGTSPVTTGLRNMDITISGVPNEGGDPQAHYTERVVLLPGSINHYAFDCMLEGLPSPDPVMRAAHGVPADATLFFSAANFYKIVPELSEVWFRILAQVPHSYLMLMPFNPNWTNEYPLLSFNERLAAQATAAGVGLERVRLHQPVPTIAHLHRVIEMADVYLDAFPFSGACSIYDALVVGVPLVVRAGQVCRSRHSTAILQEAGLGDWVTPDTAGYVKRAVALGRDRNRRQAERDRMAALGAARLKMADNASYGAMLTTMFDGLVSDWNNKVAELHAIPSGTIEKSISVQSRRLASELTPFADGDLIERIVLPYLRHDGSRKMLDVGACMGAMSRPFLQEGWQTVMFEPDERCHPVLAVLVESCPHRARLEKAAVTYGREDKVAFHIAASPGLSGLSRSPYAFDLETRDVTAVRLGPYIASNSLSDVDFIKIDAEGHDLAILEDLDFGAMAPRLLMVEFGDQFATQGRAAIEAVLRRTRERGYRACVVCARALGDFNRHEWDTGLLGIDIDAVPEVPQGVPLFGNILFFREDDRNFLPSILAWLGQIEDWKGRGLLPAS